MVFILEGSTNGIQIKHIRDNQSIATSKVELYDGNNSATGATKFYLVLILIYNSDIIYKKYIKPKFIIWYKKEFQMSKMYI